MIDKVGNFTGVCHTNIFSITSHYLFINSIFKYFMFLEVQKYIIQIVTNNIFAVFVAQRVSFKLSDIVSY